MNLSSAKINDYWIMPKEIRKASYGRHGDYVIQVIDITEDGPVTIFKCKTIKDDLNWAIIGGVFTMNENSGAFNLYKLFQREGKRYWPITKPCQQCLKL